MNIKDIDVKKEFNDIIKWAKENSTCKKLAVGSGFIRDNGHGIYTRYYEWNASDDFNCKKQNECYKAKVTGVYESVEWTRKFCKAKHAEVRMIDLLKYHELTNEEIKNGILMVTRYPCVNCANECVKAGFSKIIYAGIQEISDEVKKIFNDAKVEVEWHPEIDFEF